MQAATHLKPPRLDEFDCTAEDDLRALDLAAPGFNEEMIWGEPAKVP